MQTNSETFKQDLNQPTNKQLQQVADFIAFLKFWDKRDLIFLDPVQLATLVTEFAKKNSLSYRSRNELYAAKLYQED